MSAGGLLEWRPRPGDPGVRASRLEAALVLGLAIALVVSRARLVAIFGARWTDEDQAILWYTASELLDGRVHEPYFYGQSYGSWLESLLAVPLVGVGIPLRVALPSAAALLGTAPWLLFAAMAWRRRRPLAAIALLALPAAMSVEGSILATMPRGLLPGIALGVLAALFVLAWPSSPLAIEVFGLLLVLAASVNVGSGLVTGPVAVWFGLTALGDGRTAWRRRLVPFAFGLVSGAVLHVLAQAFYRRNPGHSLHGSPSLDFSVPRLTENLGRLDRYLPAFAPELWPHWSFLAVVVVVVAVATTAHHRTWAIAAACATSIVLAIVVLGTAKANDGAVSIYFPYARLYLGLPWAVGALALLPTHDHDVAPHGRHGIGRTLLAVVIAGAALGNLALREVRLDERLHQLLVQAAPVPPIAPVATGDLERRCALRGRLAERHDVTVVVERYDRAAAYACDALLGASVTTLYPEYDRRTWLWEDAQRRQVDRLLVSGLERCPAEALGPTDGCEVADAGNGLYLLSGPPRPIAGWVRQLGFPTRPL